MLMGTYEHRLDTKARLVLPAKIREKLGDVVVASVGMENCVSLYSMEEWNSFLAKIKDRPFFSRSNTRELLRIILSSAHELALDGTGRVLLPPVLREYANLTQEVVVNGVNDHVEIWDKARWTNYWKTGLEKLPEIAEGVDDF